MAEKEYIEREAAVRAAKDGADAWDGGYSRYRDAHIESAINDISAADVVEVKHGRWNNGYEVQNCSECGYRGKRSYHYCPCCGAKMDGGADK